VGAVALISLVLAFLLERRVAQPVAALVEGMRRVEDGDLGARVSLPGGGEFDFLAQSLNSMVSRIEELTSGLEARVESATRDLAAKNEQLSAVNARLLEAQLEVARAERLAAHGQMAATIAHELGTPLNSVLGYAQLLLRDESEPERLEKLSVIESQVQRMAETIRGVLDRVRDEAFDSAPVEVEPLVTESLALVSPQLESRKLLVRTQIEPDLPPLPGDASALRQVLINLLTNAIDATAPPGTITVTAAIPKENSSPGAFLELAVCDTGAGMTPEQLQKAREPFYTTKEPGRGTGLGLVIVDHIVRAHRGSLLIESGPGRGTTVRVRLALES
jgi:signal transduction histidine kinase